MNSCIRFKILMNVDLPQPDGPINAVTVPEKKSIEISSSTCFLPNHACTPLASRPVEPAVGWPTFARLADATSESEWVATDCFPALRS